jgi:hypothetical protein
MTSLPVTTMPVFRPVMSESVFLVAVFIARSFPWFFI